jgi:hypothetical protein
MEQVPFNRALSFGRKATKGGIVSALGSRDKTRTSRKYHSRDEVDYAEVGFFCHEPIIL